MPEGRQLVFPTALAFGARPVTVPGRGNVLCLSAALPLRLSDSTPVPPADWYQAVADHGGPTAIPDAMAPVPGAEVLILGSVPPVVDSVREASVCCGEAMRNFTLRKNPEAPDTPWVPGPDMAAWHEQDNPMGRGGPEDSREPLILDSDRQERPLWLGATPPDHPHRTRHMGTPEATKGAGWASDASPKVHHEAHEGFWTSTLYAGDPLTITGLGENDLDTNLPHYRVNIASARMLPGVGGEAPNVPADWILETVRIHCVTLIPAADLGAVIWRSIIDVGDDVLGERVVALVVALEDVDAPKRDEMDLGVIARERWMDPIQAADDRPLLPAAMAASVQLPFSVPDGGGEVAARQAAAEQWARDEMGLDKNQNPFEKTEATKEFEKAAEGEEEQPPDLNALDAIAKGVLGQAKEKHEKIGFTDPPDQTEARPAIPRGVTLDAEIEKRLDRPYQSEREQQMVMGFQHAPAGALPKEEDLLGKITEARLLSGQPSMYWPAFVEDEGERFGQKVFERLGKADLGRHIDVSGAILGSVAGALATGMADDADNVVSGRVFDGVLAEETIWRGIEFNNCELRETSFAGSRFENCVFRNCTFEKVNLSKVVFEYAEFSNCELRDLNGTEVVWMDSRFYDCTLERISLTDPGMRDVLFEGGAWREVQYSDALFIRVTIRNMEMYEVTYGLVHAPYSRFENVTMHKVWAMARGFPESVFENVDAKTCGFLSTCHFDGTTFDRVRFHQTGFTNAVFKDARLGVGCVFDTCDFSGAVFVATEQRETRFLNCSMATSIWWNTDATGAWFMGSTLRGVDFANTKLAQAVFTDADLEGTTFEADLTIGADFRGTVQALP